VLSVTIVIMNEYDVKQKKPVSHHSANISHVECVGSVSNVRLAGDAVSRKDFLQC